MSELIATSTSPLTKKDDNGQVTHVLKRKFLGNLFPESTDESNELKAYKKGHTHYFFKNEGIAVTSAMQPIRMKEVRQEYYYKSIKG